MINLGIRRSGEDNHHLDADVSTVYKCKRSCIRIGGSLFHRDGARSHRDKKYSGVKFPAMLTVFKPLISAAVMGAVVILVYKGLMMVTDSNGTSTLAAILAGVIVYGLMIIRTKSIEREEMMNVSSGKKLVAICDKLRLW